MPSDDEADISFKITPGRSGSLFQGKQAFNEKDYSSIPPRKWVGQRQFTGLDCATRAGTVRSSLIRNLQSPTFQPRNYCGLDRSNTLTPYCEWISSWNNDDLPECREYRLPRRGSALLLDSRPSPHPCRNKRQRRGLAHVIPK